MPDLPYALTGVPGTSKAARPAGRLARAAIHIRHCVRTLACVAVASAVGFTLAPSSASADELTDQRQQVQAQLAQSRQELGESTTQLTSAANAVESAQSELAAARDELAATRVELATARSNDKAMAAKLVAAEASLAKARADVATGQQKLDAEHDLAGAMVRDQYQQQTNLIPVAILVSSESTADLGTRLQWSTTMFDTTQAYIDRLNVLQAALKVERGKQVDLETQMAADRKVAADNLATQKRLEARAAAETAGVAYLVRQRTAAQAVAARAVASDQQEVRDLSREQAAVDHRIAVRIAQAKAEAARKAAAAKAKAARDAAAAKAKAAREAAAAKLASAKAARAAAKERAHERAVAEKARKAAAAEDARIKAAERASRTASKKHRAAVLKQLKQDKKAAQAKKAATEAKAKKAAAKAKKAAAKAKAKSSKAKASKPRKSTKAKKKKAVSGSSGSSSSSAHHGFIYPVRGPITSPYGRRFHPILHVWKLHDGTDFGASCGTPIRAAHSGRVAEKFYSKAYGNRLMIDHGTIDGRYVTTGYNHAERYRVSVGDHVREGEVIGYVGATGYATGCHLHLMVWLDGHRVNPMGWLY